MYPPFLKTITNAIGNSVNLRAESSEEVICSEKRDKYFRPLLRRRLAIYFNILEKNSPSWDPFVDTPFKKRVQQYLLKITGCLALFKKFENLFSNWQF